MKSNNLHFFSFLIIMAVLLTGTLCSVSASASVSEAEKIISEIVALSEADSVQEWIDSTLCDGTGGTSEWYVIALSEQGDYDFSDYEKALLEYLSSHSVSSASSRLKFALALAAVGSTDPYITEAMNNSIGQQGIMSYVFGLHLLNNGYKCQSFTQSSVLSQLLSMQGDDGGWRVMGKMSDVDTTAMVVQALAPHYNGNSSVQAAVDNALSFLSAAQKSSGGFASYGVENIESTSQVIIALSALSVDITADSRFIKNSKTVFDAINSFKLSDSSYCHTAGGGSNAMATAQVFCSMVSYVGMKNGNTPFYILDNRKSDSVNTGVENIQKITENTSESDEKVSSSEMHKNTVNTQSAEEHTSEGHFQEKSQAQSESGVTAYETTASASAENILTDGTTDQAHSQKKLGYKVWVTGGIVIVAAGIALVLLLKKKSPKNLIIIGVAAAVGIAFVLLNDFESVDSYYNSEAEKVSVVGSVTLTIRCDTIPDKASEHIPDNGVILEKTDFEITEGDTVYTLLLQATKEHKIHLESSGGEDAPYIEGINNIYEFDFGSLSGWQYFVNGESSSVGCGDYILSDSDEVEWLYTCNMGEDLK